MKILALPRDRNPYQENLYRRLRDRGAVIDYLDGPTNSQTVNLALLPMMLFLGRLQGYRLLHVHWVFAFVPGWAQSPPLTRLFRFWYSVVLTLARLLGLHVVWTAHNILPHSPVFDDDVAARLSLVRRCDHVIAMNPWVAETVQRRFAPDCPVSVIPHGVEPTATVGGAEARQATSVRRIVFFGRIEPYKGVDDLIRAYAAATLPDDTVLDIAGPCDDGTLAASLRRLAATTTDRGVRLRLRALEDSELTAFLSAADVIVLPFRTISTSGSLLTAMQSGRPVVVPQLPPFADIPGDALMRYESGPTGLQQALERAVVASVDQRRATVEAAQRYLGTIDWDAMAAQYAVIFERLLERST